MDQSKSNRERSLDDTLAHYGISGMRWGHRKSSSAVSTTAGTENPVSIYSKTGKGITKTTGGENRPLSDDAKKSAVYKQMARKSSVDSLSNEQIRHLVGRMKLEQEYSKVANRTNTKSKGRKFIEGLIKTEGAVLVGGKQGPLTKMVGSLMGEKSGKSTKGAKAVGPILLNASAYKVRRSTAAEMA